MAATESQIGVNTNLQQQDLSNLDISNLTALSPEVISRQATINIGTIGHVAHGKSTVVKAISGVQTVRFKNELERNITIKLERLKEADINKLLTSPNYLKNFEELQQMKMEKRRYLKEMNYMKNCYQKNNSLALDVICQDGHFQHLHLRGNSSSPSSGYGSIYGCNEDNKSIVSNYSNNTNNNSPRSSNKSNNKKTVSSSSSIQDSLKRRYSQTSISPSSNQVSNKKRRKSLSSTSSTIAAKKGEYIIEDIECVESVNGNPVFFVKWLNYPSAQNTWESIDNLNDCLILEQFIENRYNFFHQIIKDLITEIEMEIEKDQLAIDVATLSMKTLEKFEPLKLKADLILLAQFKEARSRNIREPEKIRKRLLKMLLLKPFYNLRVQQLKEIKDFQEKMNKVEDQAPINIENNVDFEVPEPGFVYIKESFNGKDVHINEDTPIGCYCEDGICQPITKCCARMAGNYFAYDKTGRLRIPTGEAIYECNRMCSCDSSCPNRIIQKGRHNCLCLFKTSNGCGWGVRTEKFIRKGEFVCEYVGEIITCEVANERGKLYDAKGRTYLFDLDYNTTQDSMYTIDAAMYGNISHFINHSCEPNLAVFPYWINNLDINMPGLAFFSLRQIKPGEELTFDYIRSDLEERAEDNVYENLSDAEKVVCRCGAEKCRKVLF